MLAVDASHSMDALDFTVEGRQVSRMQVVKGVMGRFIDGRAGDRIGLIIFGSGAYVLSPLTIDRNAVHHAAGERRAEHRRRQHRPGRRHRAGRQEARDRPPGSRVMILIADGDNTAGNFQPLEAAALAAAPACASTSSASAATGSASRSGTRAASNTGTT
jgi:Ca-activated chloride channel family protein